MNQDQPADQNSSPREQVRYLGFDPDHLTSAEQEELLEIEATLRRSAQTSDQLLART